MTRDEHPSARWSARVDRPNIVVPGQRGADSFTAPESRDNSALSCTRSEGRGRRISRDKLDEISRNLTDRDLEILRSVANYGLLRTTHMQQLHFYDHATPDAAARIARRTLQRLRDYRVIEPIERRIGGIRAGSQGTVWQLGPTGDRLLRDADVASRRARRREPSLRFLEHRMLVADAACALTTAAHHGELELLRIDPEPASWRPYGGLHGAREILKPDLFAVTASGEYEDSWFIEVDRGTESLPTLLKQCSQYETYRRTGSEQTKHGVFPRVLWLVPTARRGDRLREALRADRHLDAELFRIHIFDELLDLVRGGAS